MRMNLNYKDIMESRPTFENRKISFKNKINITFYNKNNNFL